MYLPFNTSASWTKKLIAHVACCFWDWSRPPAWSVQAVRHVWQHLREGPSKARERARGNAWPYQGPSFWGRGVHGHVPWPSHWGPSCGCPISDIDTVDTLIPNRYLIPTTKFDEQIISDVNTVPSQKPDWLSLPGSEISRNKRFKAIQAIQYSTVNAGKGKALYLGESFKVCMVCMVLVQKKHPDGSFQD